MAQFASPELDIAALIPGVTCRSSLLNRFTAARGQQQRRTPN
jgi:hypothetical protein